MNTTQIPTTGGPYVAITEIVPVTHEQLVERAIRQALDTPAPDDDSKVTFVPPHGRQYGPKNAWDMPDWTPEDQAAIDWAVAGYDQRQRNILRILIDLEGEYIATGALLPAAGYEPDTRASGLFRAIAGSCRANGRKPFWDGAPQQGNGRLLKIDPQRGDVREMLDRALKEYGT